MTWPPPWIPWSVAGCLGLLFGLGGLGALFVAQSFQTTNPPGYEHRGPEAGLQPFPTDSRYGTDPQRDFGLAFQEVAFPTANRAVLRGWLVPGAPTSAVGVVTVHGRGVDRRDFLHHLPVFHAEGAPTLLFDLREHGISDGAQRGMSLGFREAEDVSAAVRFLKETTGVRRAVVVGSSLGASSAILAAAADPAIDAVIAESPIAAFEEYLQDVSAQQVARTRVLRLPAAWTARWAELLVDFTAWRIGVPTLQAPVEVIDRIAPRPLLLIHGTADSAVPPAHAARLYAQAKEPKQLWLAEGAEHGQAFDRHPEEYRARVSAFLRLLS